MDPQPESAHGPWNPDRQWADPLITLLALICIYIAMAQMNFRTNAPVKESDHVSLVGRVAEIQALGQRLGGGKGVFKGGLAALQDRTKAPWDRALLAVLLAEAGDTEQARLLALEGTVPSGPGAAFRHGWTWAYAEDTPLTVEDQVKVARALGDGYGARLLRARWAEKAGGDGRSLRREAEALAMGKVAIFGALGILALALVFAGLVFAMMLFLTRRVPRRFAPTVYAVGPRAALLVFLGWLTLQMSSGFLVAPIVMALPILKPVLLPLAYGLHATAGLTFLCLAEGITFSQLLRRVAPGAHGRSLVWGLGFLTLAVASVLAVALLFSPLLKDAQPPQRELLDLVTNTRGPLALPLLFLTVAVVAPCFEELMFRGFLLPWLAHAWKDLKGGTALALLVSGLLFGLIHLQPAALPTLATLGIVLGLAVLRTGNLLTSILVHGLWNGAVFLFMRFLLA